MTPASDTTTDAQRGNGCVVLMYHVIDTPETDGERQWCCEPDRFREQMQWLRDSGHVPVTISRVAAWLAGRDTLPDKAVCVTFDDGTRCQLERALPILHKYGIPATSYVVAGMLGDTTLRLHGGSWADRPLLSAGDLRAMSDGGVEIGSHSFTHADLAASPADTVLRELVDSRHRLEDLMGRPVPHLAYPFGRLGRVAYDCAREAGYETAVTVADGIVRKGDDPLLLNRVEVYHWDTLERFARKVRTGSADPELNARTIRRLARRALQRAGFNFLRQPA